MELMRMKDAHLGDGFLDVECLESLPCKANLGDSKHRGNHGELLSACKPLQGPFITKNSNIIF